jgi:hypothetical protein
MLQVAPGGQAAVNRTLDAMPTPIRSSRATVLPHARAIFRPVPSFRPSAALRRLSGSARLLGLGDGSVEQAITAGSSMQAMTRSAPPQAGQISMSMPKTRLSRCAQVIAARRCVGVLSCPSSEALGWAPLPRFAGVTAARCGLFGASTPAPSSKRSVGGLKRRAFFWYSSCLKHRTLCLSQPFWFNSDFRGSLTVTQEYRVLAQFHRVNEPIFYLG